MISRILKVLWECWSINHS